MTDLPIRGGQPAGAAARSYRAPVPNRPKADRRYAAWQPFAAVLFFVLMVTLTGLWASNPAIWGVGSGVLVVPLLTALSIPLFVRARREGVLFDCAGIMAVGLFLRFIVSLHRYANLQDAGLYHIVGTHLADAFRNFQFDVDTGRPFPGTGGMRYITGLVEVLTNNNLFATFLVFTWLGFVGCYLFYRAIATAMPDADHHRYALLIFLWPSMVYWPSSIGKDCWILFTIGLASLGAARVLVRRPGGYVLFTVGLLLASIVRPHIAVVALIGFAICLLIGRRTTVSTRAITPASVAKVAGLVILLAVGAVLANRLGDFFEANDITGIDNAIETNVDRTSGEGTSVFDTPNPTNPVGYAQSAITILFRPFVFEASGIEQFVTGLEALFLAGLAIASWRRLASVPFRLRRDPYVAYATFVVLMLVFVLGTIANFGILARQRTQVMPFVFVLLCVTVVAQVKPPRPPVRPRLRTP